VWSTHRNKPKIEKGVVFDHFWNMYGESFVWSTKDFTFPDVPWDKSLIAPDGSMPLIAAMWPVSYEYQDRKEEAPKPKAPEKLDIRDFCKKHQVWAAKYAGEDIRGNWYTFSSMPHRLSAIWRGQNRNRAKDLIYPDVPWEKSLIAPDGSMPFWGNR